MKLLSHSNGVHKLDREKVSKAKYFKVVALVIVGIIVFGFVAQVITNIIDNTKLKSKFKYVTIEGYKMEYRLKTGGNYTVVFDGSIGNTMFEWEKVYSSLEEKKISTFIYNRRGYGFNDGVDARTPEDQAKDLKVLLKKAGAPQPYILVGEEYGSLVMTNFSKLYPDSVAGVVLVNPLSEEKIKTQEYKDKLKPLCYKSEFEAMGTYFSLTSLLSNMGATTENKTFKENISQNELEEFNSFENKKYYRSAVSNELGNLYKGYSNSQTAGMLGNKPFYLITNNEDDSIKKLGGEETTTIYKEEKQEAPISLLDSNSIVNGVNSIIKDLKKLEKKQ
ncbi:pimeloyl-ACP methyl ester carboxylesterase [Clostridium saccharoperbutylacetonicum]|uniref:Alpha/beta hydrolase fold protein n=1 Tax=Clostridium saccharoperbutylacetonicum N1-4(HMT) TaxID=931276 RepID=M1M8Q9_9CLOT|nr:alpha/beta hydrolase [Clostridium saccharoperbutylacetonicum]AGF54319.1 alpha/beta hydrolase fold protein [Clostridium saccharoperbutylacetonicum N1-4(HMT)]NRT59165.1 pimeloyl-ACP methyl ester carboxylesterase [Clostridium saccharoperbutylacetonicum]NSB28354.1 pimeloyl-ACP methyl ester carboxylesterase [Clostridium saccharoperbutylacetonicum]NSB41842.1 pimeloyl-ACP methyl ester carboxylesterase [Clostridium saccharoperbutylacetonicum]